MRVVGCTHLNVLPVASPLACALVARYNVEGYILGGKCLTVAGILFMGLSAIARNHDDRRVSSGPNWNQCEPLSSTVMTTERNCPTIGYGQWIFRSQQSLCYLVGHRQERKGGFRVRTPQYVSAFTSQCRITGPTLNSSHTESCPMSVIAEISIGAEEFKFGEALAAGPPAHIELERVVPGDEAAIPYLWVETDDVNSFEESLRKLPEVERIDRLDQVNDRTLYRMEWAAKDGLLVGILASDGAILEAHGGNEWMFQLRFDDHERLGEFYNFCMQAGIKITVDRVFTLTEGNRRGRRFDLTEEQREALVIAANLGYFESPSKVTLDEVGGELGISSQAASKRIRGGVEKLVNNALLTTA